MSVTMGDIHTECIVKVEPLERIGSVFVSSLRTIEEDDIKRERERINEKSSGEILPDVSEEGTTERVLIKTEEVIVKELYNNLGELGNVDFADASGGPPSKNNIKIPRNPLKVQETKGKHYCSCGKSFKYPSALIRHQRTHSGEKPYSCDMCASVFAQLGHLNVHKLSHIGQKQFPCKVCKSAFFRANQLETHMHIHTGKKPYSCKFCKVAFSQTAHLKAHERSHTGEKPFSCDICGAVFAQAHHLKKHKGTHSKKKLYECDICTAVFTRVKGLHYHMKMHTIIQNMLT